MATDTSALERLKAMGKAHGNRLTIDQLGREVPVDTMTPEEVAAVIERLEASGIDVELTDERLRRARPSGEYQRGVGVVDLASPAAPAVSVPGVHPSRHGWEDEGHGYAHGHHHGARKAPTWNRGGVDLLPVASLVVVALVLIGTLGGH